MVLDKSEMLEVEQQKFDCRFKLEEQRHKNKMIELDKILEIAKVNPHYNLKE